ncbi:hypothetical protein H6S82_09380 [Planktothrix sp. FACHB-1355]|uniref:Uncharacterized protein n=1 Tax=Aerosakkonema funiforme FACHB-1375 TaxID=2949571 RepID=A0A926ZJU9_9CYAN|nr:MULTISPECIES: hypothetical protein [Oscillatoriales]MBD2184762.1 hypothetical protein [Aerosakkonema funiforme FACHB-1375]MBD3559069.1 hypothetical protein [Planktothrix sp. FACHB-1355]
MPIDPITWTIIIGSFLAGATVGYFWDELRAWATRVIGYLLARINRAIEVTSDAIVYLVREGKRYYKKVEMFSRNIYTKVTSLLSDKKEIYQGDIPEDLNKQLEYKSKLELGRAST